MATSNTALFGCLTALNTARFSDSSLHRLDELRLALTAGAACGLINSVQYERQQSIVDTTLGEIATIDNEDDARLKLSVLSAQLITLFESCLDNPQFRLAAYGTLRPGESNHHIVDMIAGNWYGGHVRGSIRTENNYPVLYWDEAGEAIPVSVLVSQQLPFHYDRIDEFEGTNYARVLHPIYFDDGRMQVCNIYAKRALQ